ncbi:phage integrase central domain-containing protein [Agrobacterium larrymoorei]|uniref:phage integrase central domain-containing protein n=1 Tax=Agrobacterium larrymoorei TaxID=160699 RepID=UPI0030C5DA18
MKKLEKVIGRKQAEETFQVIAEEWHELTKPTWTDRHAHDVLDTLRRDVFPLIGDMPIRSIDARTVLGVLKIVEKAARSKQRSGYGADIERIRLRHFFRPRRC